MTNIIILVSVVVIILTLPLLYFSKKISKAKKEEAEKIIYSMLENFSSVTKYTMDGKIISGSFKGFPFQIYIHYNHEIAIQYLITLNGNFPEQKKFMFDYPKFGNGIIWRGNSLSKTLRITSSHEDIHLTLNEMTAVAKDLGNNTLNSSLSANEVNSKSTQYILFFVCFMASIFLCVDIYMPSNSHIEGVLSGKSSSHIGKSGSYKIKVIDSGLTTHSFDVTPPIFDKLKKGNKVSVIQSFILHRTTHVIIQNKSHNQYLLQTNIIMYSITLVALVCSMGGVFMGLQALFSSTKNS